MKNFISVILENIIYYNDKNLKFVNLDHRNTQRNIWRDNNFNPIHHIKKSLKQLKLEAEEITLISNSSKK